MTRGALVYFDAFVQDLEDLAFEYKARMLAGNPRKVAEAQYEEGSRDTWLAKNTKPSKLET